MRQALCTVAPPDVMVAQVEQRMFDLWRMDRHADGFVNADVRAQVTGYLVRQATKKARMSTRANAL